MLHCGSIKPSGLLEQNALIRSWRDPTPIDFLLVVKQVVSGIALGGARWRGPGRRGRRVVPSVWRSGPGSDFAEEPVCRCEPVTQATSRCLMCPARARCQRLAGGCARRRR